MYTTFRPILLLLLLAASLSASDENWTPQRVPTTGTIPFVLYYQQFLRVNPFAIEAQPRTPEAIAENRRRHQRAAELYTAMAEVAKRLAESDDLLVAAPAGSEKKDSDRIKGSWNLYPHVPLNAADLRQESLYMKYRALSHETALDPNKIGTMHDFIAGLEKDTDLLPLFQALKRNACSHALSLAHHPLKTYMEKPNTALPNEADIGKKLSVAVEWFVPFVQKYPNEDNLKLVDSFFETIDLYRSCYPDSSRLSEFIEPFRSALTGILDQQIVRRTKDNILEHVIMYLGILRRQELCSRSRLF